MKRTLAFITLLVLAIGCDGGHVDRADARQPGSPDTAHGDHAVP